MIKDYITYLAAFVLSRFGVRLNCTSVWSKNGAIATHIIMWHGVAIASASINDDIATIRLFGDFGDGYISSLLDQIKLSSITYL